MPRESPLVRTAVVAFSVLIGAAPASAIAADTSSVTIVNGTRTVMVALQLKPSGGTWTEILDRKRLSVRQDFVYQLPPGLCDHYDIRAVFDDGHVVSKMGQDLCKSPYLLTDF